MEKFVLNITNDEIYNKRITGILIGLSYGDGHIRQSSKESAELCISHCKKQSEYLAHVRDVLSEAFNKQINIYEYVNKRYDKIYIAKRFSLINKELLTLQKAIYLNKIKVYSKYMLNSLTPEGIAYWYMDDGNLSPKKRNGKIHAYDLSISTYVSKEQNQIIIDFFKEKYDLIFTIRKNRGKYLIRCGTRMARKFCDLVRPYIHESMKYKIFPL